MTEASSFFFLFFLPQTRSTTFFLLILNKYIFTFLCYVHYVNNLKTKCYKRTYNLVPVNRSEEGGTVVSTEWLLHKNKN